MTKSITITVAAARFEDDDDCLQAAADACADALDLDGWDLAPRWASNQRDEIVLTVPAPHCNDAAAWDALRMFGWHPGR